MPEPETVLILCLYCGEWREMPAQYATRPHVGTCASWVCQYQRLDWQHEKMMTVFEANVVLASDA